MRRGIKEMDVILSRYADPAAGHSDAGCSTPTRRCSENDQDLYQWVSGQRPTPAALAPLVADIRASLGTDERSGLSPRCRDFFAPFNGFFGNCRDSAVRGCTGRSIHERTWHIAPHRRTGILGGYLDALALVERLHRLLLDVIKDEFERLGVLDINAVQALLLFNIGENEVTAGELKTRGYYQGSMSATTSRSWSRWATCTTSAARSTAARCACG